MDHSSEKLAEGSLVGRTIHSFVIKIWRVENGTCTNQPTWQGHITHVPGNQKQGLQSLKDISEFIKPYLRSMGVRISSAWTLSQWLAWKLGKGLR